ARERVADALEDLVGAPNALLQRGGTRDDGALVMSSRELRSCARAGLALGAHTVDHVVLPNEAPARAWRELTRPRREVEAISGRPCTAIAWCNGLHSPAITERARAAGYTLGLTTRDAPNYPGADPLVLGRKVLGDRHLRGPLGRLS